MLYFTSGPPPSPSWSSTPPVVPGRHPGHHVLDRAAPRRRAPQHLLAGLGQTRLVQPVAPWNAEATVFVHNYTRFDPARLMAEMDRAGVTRLRAPERSGGC